MNDDEGKRTRLTKEAVVDGALRLADTVGFDVLTMRKLAQELGVTPMALYWHFRSKDELFGGLAERLWSEVDTNVDRTAPWPAQVRVLLESLLQVLRAHPAAARLLWQSQGPANSESFLRVAEIALEILQSAGFDGEHANSIARYALGTAIMLVATEPGIESRSPDERAESQRKKQVMLATLSSARYPQLVEWAAPLTAYDNPKLHYDLGITLFIAGMEVTAARLTSQ